MRRRQLFALFLGFSLLWSVGCDLNTRTSAGASQGPGNIPGPGGGNQGGARTAPILFAVEPDPLQICAGDIIRMIGINFSQDLSNNVVLFSGGGNRIPGIPLRVDFPTDGNQTNGLESELTVLVPGGVVTGNVELQVAGVVAGASGYEACPQIMGFTLGANGTQELLSYSTVLGFNAQSSFVQLYGINFNDIEAVLFEDSQGSSAQILPNTVQRNLPFPTAPPATPGQGPVGYVSIGFNLRDARNDIRLQFLPDRRDNLKIRIRGTAGLSNTIEVPVYADNTGSTVPQRLGAVINAVKVPTGVVTGAVRVHYSMYDRLVDANYRMDMFWRVVIGENDPPEFGEWQPAAPAVNDPVHSGRTGILPGMILQSTQHRLFPGGGALRAYTWDAQNDPAFRRFNERVINGQSVARTWTIEFRLSPVVEPNNFDAPRRPVPNHNVVTPQILYFDLEDRPGESVASSRTATFVETFAKDTNEDRSTTASWGPPGNPGSLVGEPPRNPPAAFGDGVSDVVLLNPPLEDRHPDAVRAYFEWSTLDMTILYKEISNDGGTPCDPSDDELAGGANSVRPVAFDNPGDADGEFHFASLTVGEGVEVLVRGPNPLILKLNGRNDGTPDPDFLMEADSFLDLNGCPGEDGPRPGAPNDVPGRGGVGGPGAGAGGDGGTFETAGVNIRVVAAKDGGRDGGRAGETTSAFETDLTKASRFPGGPGGGGGNRTPGVAGDSGAPQPTRYAPPRAGAGGVARGEPKLLLLSPGSGGGGAGGTLGVTANVPLLGYNGGAGGGGGGGALRLVVNGSVRLDPSARILADGGAGGNGLTPATADGSAPVAPGGGGSGGCLVVQASESVEANCTSFSVAGGLGGNGKPTRQNNFVGSGNGGDGWIRVESASGGVPTCSPIQAFTTLSAAADTRATKLSVASTAGFPPSGRLAVVNATTGVVLEEMGFRVLDATTFDPVTRTTPVALAAGSAVFLRGLISPLRDDILTGGKVLTSPSKIAFGRGRDQEVHIFFAPSTDPISGDLLTDPETGEVISIYTFDTDLSVITRPSGEALLETRAVDTEPGFLDCTRLTIDANTILRCVGSNPVRISVLGQAQIAGTIDVSGAAGGALRFSDVGLDPLPGLGGRGGAGGADGGTGGTTIFVNGNLEDKSASNTLPIHGEAANAPSNLPTGFEDKTSPGFGGHRPGDALGPGPSFLRARGGVSLRGQDCGGAGQPPCISTAGGGGGGGNSQSGSDGSAFPIPEGVGGSAGSIFNLDTLRFGGVLVARGGTAGAGGGASPNTSGEYQVGIAGSYRFRRSALHAPGTGGGGGGGALLLEVENLMLRRTARILAKGGDAYQSIDLGGNGGAGAGGTVLIQVTNALTVEPGAVIDVSGGVANLSPPVLLGQSTPEYPGNIRENAASEVAGRGGNGAPGRIRLEVAAGSRAESSGLNTNWFAGQFLVDTSLSIGVSKAIRLGLGPGLVASSPTFRLLSPVRKFFEFGQPAGTDSAILWQGAAESLDQHGAPAAFSALTGVDALLGSEDPAALPGVQYVRFLIPIQSENLTQATQAIREVDLPYTLPASTEP